MVRAVTEAERAFDEAVPVEAAVQWITAALALCRADGQRKDRMGARQQITEALEALGGDAWSSGMPALWLIVCFARRYQAVGSLSQYR